MSTPFDTSLRRDPDDSRGLLERIESVVRERIEEAVEFACMDLLVQRRRLQHRPAPEAAKPSDQKELQGLVHELLLHLRGAFLDGLPVESARKVAQAEEAQGQEEVRRLLAGQTALARTLPDYWERFQALTSAFVQARLRPPPTRGFLDRFFRRP